MKKNSIICILLAILVLMTGCNKEQDFVTLNAVIDQPTKVYIGNVGNDKYPFWNTGDKVYINDDQYELQNISNTTASILNVESNDGYRAVYPASLVSQGTNILNGYSSYDGITVTLDNQDYNTVELNDGGSTVVKQKIKLPMGAYIGSGNTLVFHNLCSVIRLELTNTLTSREAMEIQKITVKAASSYLSGIGKAYITGDETGDKIVITSNGGKHDVSLIVHGLTLTRNETATFDIFVPEFSSDDITFRIETQNGYVEAMATSVSLDHSRIATITHSISNLIPYPATLLPGPDFNTQAASAAGALSNIQHVVFRYGSNETSSYRFDYNPNNDPNLTPIYGIYENGTLTLHTAADQIRANRNCMGMFKNFTALEECPDFDGFNTQSSELDGKTGETNNYYGKHFIAEPIESMQEMFMGCTSLSSFNLGVFTTNILKTMFDMFNGCTALASITNIGFQNQQSLFNTATVQIMGNMFHGCTSLSSINLSSLNLSNVSSVNSLFNGCTGLQSIIFPSSEFAPIRVNNMEFMFKGCNNVNLTSLDLSSFNTENVTTMKGLFQYCSHLQTITLPTSNTKQVGTMESMFDGCNALTTINNFSTFFNNDNNGSSVLWTTQYMFQNCSSLSSIVFPNGNSNSSGNNKFNTSHVRSMYGMFKGCSGLRALDISGFTTSRDEEINLSHMFNGCTNLSNGGTFTFSQDLANGHVTTLEGMFRDCSSLSSLNLNFNTQYVTTMKFMFYGCNKLSDLTLGPRFVMGNAQSRPYYGSMLYHIGWNYRNNPSVTVTVTCNVEDVATFLDNGRGNAAGADNAYINIQYVNSNSKSGK